jgi:hypothetical protein
MLTFGVTEHSHFPQLRHEFFKTNKEKNHRLLYIWGPYKARNKQCMLDVYVRQVYAYMQHVGIPEKKLLLGSLQLSFKLNTVKQFHNKNCIIAKSHSVIIFKKTVEIFFLKLFSCCEIFSRSDRKYLNRKPILVIALLAGEKIETTRKSFLQNVEITYINENYISSTTVQTIVSRVTLVLVYWRFG